MEQADKNCPYCEGTGECDSGGIHPWGAPALIPCRCAYEDPFHVHVSDYNNIVKQLEELRSERTAWRVTAENAEKQLEDLKASIGSPKHIGLEQAQEEGLLDAPYQPEA